MEPLNWALNSLTAHLPYLRRYSRALAGSREEGDEHIRICLQALLNSEEELPKQPQSAKTYLFKKLHETWHPLIEQEIRHGSFSPIDKKLHKLPQSTRQALLLTGLEGFSQAQAAEILSISETEVVRLITNALTSMRELTNARVLIIEDDPLISNDLQHIIKEMGHSISFIATTCSEAITLSAHMKPELVLADLHLADDSSGLDAVHCIRATSHVPVIFITAHPELLLDESFEATYVLTKPYTVPSIKAICSQALFNR